MFRFNIENCLNENSYRINFTWQKCANILQFDKLYKISFLLELKRQKGLSDWKI